MIETKPAEYTPMYGLGFTEEVEEDDVEWVRPPRVERPHFSTSEPVAILARTWPYMASFDGPTPPAGVEAESVVTITSPKTPTETFSSASAPIHASAVALGWDVRASRSSTHHTATLFVDAGDDHEAGDVRWPAEDREHLWVEARMPGQRLGFVAWWTTRKGETAFVSATIYDPLGIRVENWVDYSPSAGEFKQQKEEPTTVWQARVKRLRERAEWMSWTYNDGTDRVEHTRLVVKAGEFSVWLDDWLRMKAPEFLAAREEKKEKARSRKKPTAPATPESEFPDLDLTEWSEEA